jgi:hypothetical protein
VFNRDFQLPVLLCGNLNVVKNPTRAVLLELSYHIFEPMEMCYILSNIYKPQIGTQKDLDLDLELELELDPDLDLDLELELELDPDLELELELELDLDILIS